MRTPLPRVVRSVIVALAFALSAAATRADQPAIRAVLDHMERAVLAGDVEGYLRHVATDDPVFLKEQQNWAADLKLHKPVEFWFTIGQPDAPAPAAQDPKAAPSEPGDAKPADPAQPQHEPPAPHEFATDRARFTLLMSWRMDESVGGAAAKLREVKYPVEFARAGDQWKYRGEIWGRVDRAPDPATGFEGVRVYYAPGLKPSAEAVAEVMPAVRKHVDALFDLHIKRVQEVKLYGSMLHLQASIYLSYKDGLGGWNEPHESVKILQRGRPRPDGLKNLLGHEYGHVATFEVFPDSNKAPWWLLEGFADFAAGHVRAMEAPSEDVVPPDDAPKDAGADKPAAAKAAAKPAILSGGPGKAAERMVINWFKSDKLADWAEITDFRSTPGHLSGHVYKQGEHFVRWFSRHFGDTSRNRWLRLQGEGKSLDDASKAVTSKSFGELDQMWRESIKRMVDEAEKAKAAEKEKANDKSEPTG